MEKRKPKPKQIVRIRYRTLADKSRSIYFDINFKGERWTETPRLYLSPLKTAQHRIANKEIEVLAENIRSMMQLDIVNGKYGFLSEHNKKMNAVIYFDEVYNKKVQNLKPSNQRLWKNSLKHFSDFVEGKVLFSQIDEDFLELYKSYLLKHIGARTAHSYFMVLKQVLNLALRDRLILSNPAMNVKGIPFEEGEIVHLTWDEVKKLNATKCSVEVVKKAFIFSIFTGLRHVDLKQIKWNMLSYSEAFNTHVLTFVQQKTGKQEYMPISEQAFEWLGIAGEPNEPIFKGLYKCTTQNNAFKDWLITAKITKPISFHKARVTFGVLQHAYDTDVATLQKLLGHKSSKSTERYYTVGDKKKIEAVGRIPILK